MSLEEAVKENTASIRELIKVISTDTGRIVAAVQTVTPEEQATPPETMTATKVLERQKVQQPAEKTVAKPAITPADIQKAATMVVKEKGRPSVNPVLDKYGLERFVDAKPEIFEALYTDLVELRGAK